MFEDLEEQGEDTLGALLRKGLRDIPAPAVSPDFDERVMRAVRRRRPWWAIDWQREGPALLVPAATGAVVFVATLFMALWMGAAGPVRITPHQVAQSAILPILQAADAGEVGPMSLLLHSRPKTASALAPSPNKR